MVVDAPGGPKGVVKGAGRKISVWETEIEGNRVAARTMPEEDQAGSKVTDTSLWMPCGLKVDPFPALGITHFEWYVPIDEHSHYYMVTWGTRTTDPEERGTVRPGGRHLLARNGRRPVQRRGRVRPGGDGAILRRGGRLEPGAPVPTRTWSSPNGASSPANTTAAFRPAAPPARAAARDPPAARLGAILAQPGPVRSRRAGRPRGVFRRPGGLARPLPAGRRLRARRSSLPIGWRCSTAARSPTSSSSTSCCTATRPENSPPSPGRRQGSG